MLHSVAHKIEEDAKQLIGIRIDHEPALDRADPAHRRALVEPERLAYVLRYLFERDNASGWRRLLHAAV